MCKKNKVAIVGAGISGLSSAHFLKERYDVTVFEKESNPGGLIKCKRVNGSLFHTCGGHVFNSKRQDVLDWFWSKFVREEEFAKAERNSVVYLDGGKEIPYPIENYVYLFDEKIQKDIISDLFSIVKNENFVPHNFEDFLKGRFGETLYSMYFQPYNEKVWRRDLKNVPLSWLEGKLPMPSALEIIFNNMNHIKEKNFVHAAFWYEKENGSQYIADKLAEGLNIKYDIDVDCLEYSNGKWLVLGELYDKIVFCGNIKDLVKMIKNVDAISPSCEKVGALESHGTTTAFCEIDKNPYSWIYQPSRKHESHRIICTGNFAKSNNGNLSEGRTTATIEFTDEIIKDDILENLERMPLNPTYITHVYNQYTYPIQDMHTRELINQMKLTLSDYNLFFTGRFADWEYYNMDAAIGAAMDLCKCL